MDYNSIINLMKEMNETEITKLEIEEEGTRICIEKGSAVQYMMQPANIPQAVMSTPAPGIIPQAEIVVQSSGAAEQKSMEIKAEDQKVEEMDGIKVLSPMVGMFYTQPSPDKPMFVKVGEKVKKGQTLCIIEAMKLMNEIESEFDGEIIKILIDNETMVEYGQPLFLMKK